MSGRTRGRNAPANQDQRPAARRQRRWSHTARGAAVGTALAVTGAALAVTFAATATAVTPASASLRIVKRVPRGALGDFTAIVAVRRTGGGGLYRKFPPPASKHHRAPSPSGSTQRPRTTGRGG